MLRDIGVAGIALVAACAPAVSAVGSAPSARAPGQRRAAAALEDCRRFDRYADLVAHVGTDLRPGDALAPQEPRAGSAVGVSRAGRFLLAWAVGHQSSDESAAKPSPRPWVACALPEAYTRDIPRLTYAAHLVRDRGVLDVQLMDERRPRLEYAVAVHLDSRSVLPRVLCRVAGADGCDATRTCQVSPQSGELVIGAWQNPAGADCAALRRAHADADLPPERLAPAGD